LRVFYSPLIFTGKQTSAEEYRQNKIYSGWQVYSKRRE